MNMESKNVWCLTVKRYVFFTALFIWACASRSVENENGKREHTDSEAKKARQKKNGECMFTRSEVESLWKLINTHKGRGHIESKEQLKALFEKAKTVSQEDFNADNKKIENQWHSSLMSSLGNAERMTAVVREEGEYRISEFGNRDDVLEFLNAIQVDERKKYEGGCRCTPFGGLIFFDHSGKVLDVLTLHHWQHVNWSNGWPDDGMLQPDSVTRLKSLLNTNRCSLLP
jgi:hypothetical protein